MEYIMKIAETITSLQVLQILFSLILHPQLCNIYHAPVPR